MSESVYTTSTPRLSAFVLICAMMTAGCGEDPGDGPGLPPAPTPSIEFTSPSDGDTIETTNPTVEIVATLEVKNLPAGGSVASGGCLFNLRE